MVFEEREELYLDLSKKELQDLCRTHNLPCYFTKAHLAKILVDHFNKRNAPSKSKRARTRPRVPSGEKVEEVDAGGADLRTFGKMESDACKVKDNYVEGNIAAVGGDANSQQCQKGKDGSACRGNWQDSFAVGNLPPVGRRNGNSNEISSRSGLASSGEIFLDSPASSFQFFVRDEEGINLYVDLNSKLSNWVKRLNDEVCINQKVCMKPWSICHELGDVRVKNVDVSAGGSIGTSRNIGEPPIRRLDENKESSKSSLTPIVHDKVAETMEFIGERNQPSSSNAISSRVEYCNHSINPNCSSLALPCHNDLDKEFVHREVSLSSGHSLNQSNTNDPHRGNAETLEGKPNSDVSLLNDCNAELGTADKSLISMCETSNVELKMCNYGALCKSKDIQKDQGSGSLREISWDTEVPEQSMHPSQQHPEKLVSESLADIVNPDAGEPTGNLPQEFICWNLGSSTSENMITVPSEEQCNVPCVKKRVFSGDNVQNNSKGNSCKRNTKSNIFEHKRKCTSVEPIERSMINLRSRKTLAREPVYDATFPRRSMRLVLKWNGWRLRTT